MLLAFLDARAPHLVDPPGPPPIELSLGAAPSPATGAAAPRAALRAPPPPRAVVQPRRPTSPVSSPLAAPSLTPSSVDGAGERADAGGEGGVGEAETGEAQGPGGCGMVARLEAALGRDSLARAALQAAGGSRVAPLRVWNGDWVASPGEDGRGLSAVREAILWEVGFAPAACRQAAVHGLVTLSLPGSPLRLALGARTWRWADLLTPRGSTGTARAAADPER